MSPQHADPTRTAGPIADRADAPVVVEEPSVHLGLTWRPLGPADAEAWHGLLGAIEAADDVPRKATLEEVADWLTTPWVDLATDTLAGFDHTGRLRAYGFVEIRPGDETCVRAFLDGGVHPEWRGGGLGRALVAWMEGRGRQMLAATGRSGPARLAAFVHASARGYRQLYAAAGFSPIRWYSDMRRDLAVPLPETPVPAGLTIETWHPELDEAVRLAHNAAFRDHWGSQPHSPASWERWRGPLAAPEWTLVATDEAGQVAGYLLSERHGAEVQGFSSGFVGALGVVPPWRRHGLAAALLGAAMRLYRDAGMAYATLDVDTENPMGAHGLYTRLGFQPTHQSVLYSVEI